MARQIPVTDTDSDADFDSNGGITELERRWARMRLCRFQVFAPSHYGPDGTCRCGDEEMAYAVGHESPITAEPQPLDWHHAVIQDVDVVETLNGHARDNGYGSFDERRLVWAAKEWMYEAAEAGFLTEEIAWVAAQRLDDTVRAHGADLSAIRGTLSEIVDDVRRYRVAELVLGDEERDRNLQVGHWLATQIEAGRMRPFVPGPQRRVIARILETAAKRPKTPPAAPASRKPTRRQLEHRIADLEAEVNELRGLERTPT